LKNQKLVVRFLTTTNRRYLSCNIRHYRLIYQLTASINESSILGVLRNHKRYILHAVNAVQEIQVQLRSERNTYDTATGRLLLAYLSEKELERYIQHNGLPDAETWAEAQTMDSLVAELGQIKNAGIVHTHKQNRHVKGFAVPIFINDQVVASLSVFLPEYRSSAAHEKEIVERLKASVGVIGQKLSA
jgi:IclR family transcriptional regulator, KDG regulon repressor